MQERKKFRFQVSRIPSAAPVRYGFRFGSYDVGSLAAGSRGWNRAWRWDCRSCSVAGVELSGPAGLPEMAPVAATLPAAEYGRYGAWPAHWRRARSASRLGWRAHAGGLANLAAAIHGGHAYLVAGRAIGRRAARAGLGPAAPLTRPATLRPLSLPLCLGSWATTWVPAVIRGRAARGLAAGDGVLRACGPSDVSWPGVGSPVRGRHPCGGVRPGRQVGRADGDQACRRGRDVPVCVPVPRMQAPAGGA